MCDEAWKLGVPPSACSCRSERRWTWGSSARRDGRVYPASVSPLSPGSSSLGPLSQPHLISSVPHFLSDISLSFSPFLHAHDPRRAFGYECRRRSISPKRIGRLLQGSGNKVSANAQSPKMSIVADEGLPLLFCHCRLSNSAPRICFRHLGWTSASILTSCLAQHRAAVRSHMRAVGAELTFGC